jgi:hypothetical protein
MAENWQQKFLTNPITFNLDDDLLYFARSPYDITDDAVINWQDFSAQFALPSNIQSNEFNYAIDTGTDGTAYVSSLSPAVTSLTDALVVYLRPANSNTITQPGFTLNGIEAPIRLPANQLLAPSDMLEAQISVLIFNDLQGAWMLQNPQTSLSSAFNSFQGYFNTAQDTGTANAYVTSNQIWHDITSPQSGAYILLEVANTNTGASTFNYCSTFALAIETCEGQPLTAGMMVAGGVSLLYLGHDNIWKLLNPIVTLNKVILTPLTGDTITLANKLTILNPAVTLATLTINMPATPVDNQIQIVSTTQIISAITVSGNGNTIIGEPTALVVGQQFTMIYDLGSTTWYPG